MTPCYVLRRNLCSSLNATLAYKHKDRTLYYKEVMLIKEHSNQSTRLIRLNCYSRQQLNNYDYLTIHLKAASIELHRSHAVQPDWVVYERFLATNFLTWPWWWSSGSPSTRTIRVRIPLTPTVFLQNLCLKRTKKTKRPGWPIWKNNFVTKLSQLLLDFK